MKATLTAVFLLLCVTSSSGQTAPDFEKMYGKPVPTYAVGEHVWMTPEYSAGGQVCRMRLHPRRTAPGVTYLSSQLPFEELQRVLNQLVPLQSRGAKKDPFVSGATGGRAEWMIYSYENVRFTFAASFEVDPDSWKERKTYTFSGGLVPAEPKKESTIPTENDFSPSRPGRVEIVTINWSGRRCAEQ